jgi:F-type H+-transporting ATPase subunit b
MLRLLSSNRKVGLMVIEVSEKVLRRELNNKTEQEKFVRELTNEVKLN